MGKGKEGDGKGEGGREEREGRLASHTIFRPCKQSWPNINIFALIYSNSVRTKHCCFPNPQNILSRTYCHW